MCLLLMNLMDIVDLDGQVNCEVVKVMKRLKFSNFVQMIVVVVVVVVVDLVLAVDVVLVLVVVSPVAVLHCFQVMFGVLLFRLEVPIWMV